MLAVNTTEPPAQKLVLGAVIVAIGNGFTIMTFAAEIALQPVALVTSTVYEPEAVAV